MEGCTLACWSSFKSARSCATWRLSASLASLATAFDMVGYKLHVFSFDFMSFNLLLDLLGCAEIGLGCC